MRGAQWAGALVCGLTLAALAPWLSGHLFLAFIGEQGNPGPLTIIDYWRAYRAFPGYTLELYGAILAPWAIPAAALAAAIFRPKPPTLYGGAHFASEAELRRAGLRAPSGLLLGKKNGRFLCASGQMGALVFAPPRSGKGVGFGIPNLLNWPGSALVTDVKLENYAVTSGFRAEHGQAVYVFSPVDQEGRTHRYNPLDFVAPAGGRRIDDIQKLTFKLMPMPPRADPMWTNEARDLLEGVLLYLLDIEPPATIGAALRLVRSIPDFNEWIATQFTAHEAALDPHARLSFTGFLQKSAKEQSGVLSSLKGALALWSNPLVDAATSATDFDPGALRRRPMTIYLGIGPADIGRLAPLVNVFLQQTFDALLRKMPGDDEPHQVLALLDEFTALGRLENVEKGIAYFAGYGVCLAPIIQDLPQLRQVYGIDAEKVFLSTARYRIAYAQNNDDTASYISRQLGFTTIKTHTSSRRVGLKGDNWTKNVSAGLARRELMLPHEVMQLPRHQAIVLVEGAAPVLADKIVYYKDKAFRDRLRPAIALPVVPPAPTAAPVVSIPERPDAPALSAEDIDAVLREASGQDR